VIKLLFDYQSLLLAIVFSGAAMSLTLLAAWFAAKEDKFLLTWSLGMFVLIAAVAAFKIYSETHSSFVGPLSFTMLSSGFALVYAASRQFSGAEKPFASAALLGAATVFLVVPPFLLSFEGVGIILANLFSALLLFMTAAQFWRCRSDAVGLISGMCGLYVATGISFALCGVVLLAEQRFSFVGMPDNWAEDLNAFISLMAIAGIGAISTAVNHLRSAQRHMLDARTDSLTGLVNRRSLLDTHSRLEPGTALIVFDIDKFKSVNDRHGHAAGDRLLKSFARCVTDVMPPAAIGARIGGEEFVIVLPATTLETAVFIANKVRQAFEGTILRVDNHPIHRTVSAGVASSGETPSSFEDVLRRADDALYIAKGEGRNTVRGEIARFAA
jgi:diguanylate cyclase (GGDEF)-like protein